MTVELGDLSRVAEIQCPQGLDRAVIDVLVPLQRGLDAEREPPGSFWFLRYRTEQQLKVYIHEREPGRAVVGRLLEERIRSGLAADPAVEGGRLFAPVTLEWREYRHDLVNLGSSSPLDDDRYGPLLYACLNAGSAYALARLGNAPTHASRQRLLLELVADGLAALALPSTEQVAYLEYHRDWAIRFPVLRAGKSSQKAWQIRARYDEEWERMVTASQNVVRGLVETCLHRRERDETPTEPLWVCSLRALVRHLEPFDGDPRCRLDPFASGPLWPALLKIFHVVANQLGLNVLNEGLAHHLLLRASASGGESRSGGSAGSIALVPGDLLAMPAASVPEGERGRFNFENQYLWDGLVASTGATGERWRQRYRSKGGDLGGWIRQSMALMHRREMSEAKDLLDHTAARRAQLRKQEPGIYHVLGRFYYGSLAYFQYRTGELDGVDRSMSAVADEIRSAIESEPFLLPFAALATDVPLKRARLAREERRWDEAEAQLQIFCDMKLDRHPLCVLADGTQVYHRTIAELLECIPDLEEQHLPALRYLQDIALRRDQLARTIEGFYTPRGLFIAHP